MTRRAPFVYQIVVMSSEWSHALVAALLLISKTIKKMSEWLYNGSPISDDQIPKEAMGFVYKITRISDGKIYFGKKLFWFSKTSMKTVVLKSGVKKKKKVKTLVPSDWRSYWSSSPELLKDVELLGEDAFIREILCLCPSKGTLSYHELKYQMDHRVLESGDKSYNGIVHVRIHWSHIKPLIEPLPKQTQET